MEQDPIFTPAAHLYTISGSALRLARVRLGLSRRAFADRCGWSKSNQQRLETRTGEVTQDVRNKIVNALQNTNQ